MNSIRYILALCSLLLVASLFAQRPDGPPDGNHDHRGGPNAMADRVLERLAGVDPETATRLKEMREQDPEAFRRELRNTMMKHGPELFRGDRDGIIKGGRAGGDRRGGGGGMEGGFPRGMLERLRREDPAQFQELLELRENDPGAFNARLGEIAREYGERYKRGRDEVRQIMEVAKRYQASTDEAEKATLREELAVLVAASFDKQMTEKEAWIAKLEADLEEQRKRLVERREKRDSLIQERLETILTGGAPEKPRRGPKKPGKPGGERR